MIKLSQAELEKRNKEIYYGARDSTVRPYFISIYVSTYLENNHHETLWCPIEKFKFLNEERLLIECKTLHFDYRYDCFIVEVYDRGGALLNRRRTSVKKPTRSDIIPYYTINNPDA